MSAMMTFYPDIKLVHMGAAMTSGTLFALRAFATLSGARWPLRLPARAASWVVDTGLLSAGSLLWATLQINPLVQTWLGAKLALLLVYVGLGTMALRRVRTPAARLAWTLAALGCFGWMVATALAHDVRGPLAWLEPVR